MGDEPENAREAVGAAGERSGPGAADPLRILVVDDQAINAESLAMVLELEGHRVETAHDGVAALAAAERFRPELVLLDIGMPRLDGYEVCRRLRTQPAGADAVVVALTGWTRDDDRERATAAGFDHHLSKPVETSVLLGLVASIAARRAG